MEYIICKSPWKKIRGLMFSEKKNLVFAFSKEKRIALHTFFVFFPIDVLFLDKNKRIIEVKMGLRPFCFYTSKNKAKYVVEIAKERKKEYRLGKKLDFE